jgi:magnesium-transporting ATPase (P-type)
MLHGTRLLRLVRHGLSMAAAGLGTLVVGHHLLGYEWEMVRTMVFTTLVGVQLAYAFAIRRSEAGGPPGRNRVLFGSVVASALLQLAVVYLPVGQTLFDTVGIPSGGWVPVLGAIAGAYWLVRLGDRPSPRDPAGP